VANQAEFATSPAFPVICPIVATKTFRAVDGKVTPATAMKLITVTVKIQFVIKPRAG